MKKKKKTKNLGNLLQVGEGLESGDECVEILHADVG
jgi:hypothetical protein